MKMIHDAGHGMYTSGKRAPDDSMREHEFNSKVVEYTIDEMEKQYTGVEHYIAHDITGYRDVPLKERTDLANKLGVDVYISYHANAFGGDWNNASGTETYVYTSRPTESVKLAEMVQRNLIADLGTKNRGVKAANFAVLRESRMPAILIEFEFMTNREALILLQSDNFRRKCARSVARSLGVFYNLKKRATVAAKPSDTGRYRLMTGTFPDAETFSDAIEKFEEKFSWLGYEKADSTGFNPTYRIVTGTFTGRESAERAAQQLREAFGWVVYVKEA